MANLPGGAGVLVQAEHFAGLLADVQRVDFIAVQAEDYFAASAVAHAPLHRLCAHLPLALHCASLGLGAAHGLHELPVQQLLALSRRYQPAQLSCALMPGLAYQPRDLAALCAQVEHLQQRLGQRLLIENAAREQAHGDDAMHELDFLTELTQRTGCGLQLDLSHWQVSRHNCADPSGDGLDRLPLAAIAGVQLAGYRQQRLADGRSRWQARHDCAINPRSWQLFAELTKRVGPLPCVVNWSQRAPSWLLLAAEVDCVRALQSSPYMPQYGEYWEA
jgi:uncharacterized protein (UPF0276 family)